MGSPLTAIAFKDSNTRITVNFALSSNSTRLNTSFSMTDSKEVPIKRREARTNKLAVTRSSTELYCLPVKIVAVGSSTKNGKATNAQIIERHIGRPFLE